MREYITDTGTKLLLIDTDERVMTAEELQRKYSTPKKVNKNNPCPYCRTYCNGDCNGKKL
jgi:hypothetical protein